MASRLLIIEDDRSLNQMLQFHFEDQGHQVEGAENCTAGLNLLTESPFDLVLLDQQLPDGTGLELLKRITAENSRQLVIMMTGQHDLELAIEAIKEGAADFIHKPINTEELQRVVDRVLETRRLSLEMESEKSTIDIALEKRDLIGRSDAMLKVSKEIALCAQNSTTVLITGESGTGKEVVARQIHLHSDHNGPFIAINCAAIVDTLLESELFGHEKGAFTGANDSKKGKFELAHDGTLFLDEIGDLALPLQAKLLRVLQEQVFERVGGNQQISTNARIITATNKDLFEEAKLGRFREDLAYRLRVVAIHLPPLRERPEDIPLLSKALLSKITNRLGKPPIRITEEALTSLQSYDWPGNVREMENLLTQAIIHSRGNILTPDLLSLQKSGKPTVTEPATAADNSQVLQSLEQIEAAHIQKVLNHTRGHKGKSCEILGISRPALDRKIKKYTLTLP